MKKSLFFLLLAGLIAFFHACGGGGGVGGGSGPEGTVSLYATDDISDYTQVGAIVNSVALLQTETGTRCTLLDGPRAVDIAKLSDEMILLSTKGCPAADYNRLELNFGRGVRLADSAGNVQTCTFTSYKDGHSGIPNILECDPVTGICSIRMNGEVDVMENKLNKIILDFDLKEFEVKGFPLPGCTVTMKVAPLDGEGLADKKDGGYLESVKGAISGVDTTAKTFTIRDDEFKATVDYSGITDTGPENQGIDELLADAQAGHWEVKVFALSIEPNTTIEAIKIEVEDGEDDDEKDGGGKGGHGKHKGWD
jgi:hypothetical protein